MTDILDKIASIWFLWMFVSFGIGIVGFGFLFYSKYGKPKNKRKITLRGAVMFGQVFLTWIIGFTLLWTVESLVRKEIRAFLNQPNLKVEINGLLLTINESEEIVSELKTIKSYAAHHSHPTLELKLRISSSHEELKLRVQQDSEYENEYWVFIDKYKNTKLNEVGRIRTGKLKKYNGG